MTQDEHQLFRDIAQLCHHHGVEEVLSACSNIIMNCMRQNYGRRRDVIARLDALYGRTMAATLEHYDATTGRRRSVTPFDQVIRPTMVESDMRILGLGGGKRNGSA